MTIRAVVMATMVFSTACSDQINTTRPTPMPVLTQPAPVPTAPAGESYVVTGFVGDSAGRAVSEATVTISSGLHAGTSAVTDKDGRFTFRNLTSLMAVRAQKEGYREQTKVPYTYASLEPGNFYVWFHLESSVRPPALVAGTYLVTFIADTACTTLPEIARERRYVTTLGTVPFQVSSLRTGDVVPGSYDNVIYVSLFEDFASLFFEDPPIEEDLGAEELEIDGHAQGLITDPRTELKVGGSFSFAQATCQSANHQLILVRSQN